jgi:zinc transporter, ZIP family
VDVNALTVAAAALVTALACGLGALPFVFGHDTLRGQVGIADAAAGGAMLAATAVLLGEGWGHGSLQLAAGVAAGIGFVALTERLLATHDETDFGALHGADARTAITIIAVMTVHSVAEGVGVGVSFGGGSELGLFITVAIAIHNIPEGFAISLVLVPRGESVGRAAWWSIFSSLPQPLLAVPAFVFVDQFRGFLPVGLGFAGGAMAWLVAAELIPSARRASGARTVAGALAVSFAAMLALQLLLSRAA